MKHKVILIIEADTPPTITFPQGSTFVHYSGGTLVEFKVERVASHEGTLLKG